MTKPSFRSRLAAITILYGTCALLLWRRDAGMPIGVGVTAGLTAAMAASLAALLLRSRSPKTRH